MKKSKSDSNPRPSPSYDLASYERGRLDGIEECAQVADEAARKYEYSLEPEIAKDIAAAIRARKDKP